MSSTEDLRQMWDAYAADFEAFVEPMSTLTGRQLLAALGLSEARSLLEVGAGAGGLARATREELAPGVRHVVTDLSPTMIGLARQKLGPAADVRVADAQALPFGDGEFDRLLANLSLMLVPDADRALAEALRVVAPGGLCAWSVWGRPEHSPMMTLPLEAAKRAGVQLPEPPRSNFHLGPRERVIERLRRAGFADVRAWYVPMAAHPRDGAEMARELVTRQPRMRTLTKDLAPEAVAALQRELAALFDELMASGGVIALDVCCVAARRP
jgi:ubiquinone/menaquinone biosynthesis C-methylase UbiE